MGLAQMLSNFIVYSSGTGTAALHEISNILCVSFSPRETNARGRDARAQQHHCTLDLTSTMFALAHSSSPPLSISNV